MTISYAKTSELVHTGSKVVLYHHHQIASVFDVHWSSLVWGKGGVMIQAMPKKCIMSDSESG